MTVEYLNLGEAEYMIIEGKMSGKIVVVVNSNLPKEAQNRFLQDIFRMLRLEQG